MRPIKKKRYTLSPNQLSARSDEERIFPTPFTPTGSTAPKSVFANESAYRMTSDATVMRNIMSASLPRTKSFLDAR